MISIKSFEVYSNLENKKLYIKKDIVSQYKNMDKDSEQNFYSGTAVGYYRIGHDSIRLKNWKS